MEVEALIQSGVRILGQGALVVYAYAWIVRGIESRAIRQPAIGFLFGFVGMLSMADPIELHPGIIYDARSILLVLSSIYSCPLGTVIAAVMMAACRLWIGGVGAASGVVGIVVIAIAGYLLSLVPVAWFGTRWRRVLVFGFATILAFTGLATLPWTVVEPLLVTSALPLMVVNISGALLLSDLLEREAYRVRIQRALENEASVDPLTKLPNRRVIQRAGDRCIEEMRTKHVPFSVLMLDIDHFKQINDTWGHAAGDTVLSVLSDVIRRELRKTDVAARFGGEEIVVLLPNTDRQSAAIVAEKLRGAVEKMVVDVDSDQISITVSIGIAGSIESSHDFVSVINAADKALYQAKNGGRNQVFLAAA
ncbi:diguanylate cyclase [Agrobacterium tumefaciens]|uniref:GGDEF domain-containing protein n=1 Tax=Agrobacterium tumefaciens TaxID=358 RepID=UPI0015749415|nr:diguanylate cyclase [Agrobacterium tumefaciens]MCZ7497329.1 diguanylate cyclase [Rhizobium rhizogenes]NTE56543.1 diguanylate cyclase [Agrobacterium tumefaciens]NTE74511.1 diguanylate cyclase [Agrobacterium tumefaciens]